ncbi:MAG: glycosyltransferase [Nitrosopumilus sp.]|nr:glycosyltransferase [Nitrosopumilus sp.]
MTILTIGMPLKNSSKYLREAIDSVIQQSFKDWVLLAVDDNSTDSTPEIIEEYAKIDSRIHLVRFDGPGVSQMENWNRIINLAESKYISIFHDDDIMAPHLLEQELKMIESHSDMVMVFAQGPFINAEGEFIKTEVGTIRRKPSWMDSRVFSQGELGPLLLLRGFIHASSVMLKVETAKSIPLFSEEFSFFFDIDYWIRIGDCGKVGYVPGDLIYYRIRAGSAMHKCWIRGTNFHDAKNIFEKMMQKWEWDSIKRKSFAQLFYRAHAGMALNAARNARSEGDFETMRLQVAICLTQAHMGNQSIARWIAKWWSRKLGQGRKIELIFSIFTSLPLIKMKLYIHYTKNLENLA